MTPITCLGRRFLLCRRRPELAVDLVLGVLADAARVEQDRVGLMDVASQLVAIPAQRGHDQLAIEHVHLAADRLDIELAVVVHFACGLAAGLRVSAASHCKDDAADRKATEDGLAGFLQRALLGFCSGGRGNCLVGGLRRGACWAAANSPAKRCLVVRL